MNVDICGDIEIEEAVIVEVAEGAPGVPGDRATEARRSGDFREGAIAVILVKKVCSDGGNHDVGETVIVIVGGISSCSPVRVGETGARGDVFEVSMAEVMVEKNASRFWRRLLTGNYAAQAFHGGPVDNKQIHEAIVVVIEPRYAATVGFRDPSLLGATAADLGADAGRCRHFREAEGADGLVRIGRERDGG